MMRKLLIILLLLYFPFILIGQMMIPGIIGSSSGGETSTLLNNLVAYWNFDESSGTFVDEVNSNVATGVSIIYNASGKLSRCVEYDATTDYIIVPNSVTYLPTNDKYSISAWFYIDVLPSTAERYYVILRMYNSTYSSSILVQLKYDTDYIAFTICNSSGTSYDTETASNSITTGAWYHLVCVNVGNGSPSLIYLNGSDATYYHSATYTGANILVPDGTMRIGNSSTVGTIAIDGRIDEIALWDRNLTSSEITELYNSGTGKTYPF